jgi:lipoyl(octanoyl) transferase
MPRHHLSHCCIQLYSLSDMRQRVISRQIHLLIYTRQFSTASQPNMWNTQLRAHLAKQLSSSSSPLVEHGMPTAPARHVVRLYNALNQGCLQYETSWAWQQVLLSRRLHSKRQRRQGNTSNYADEDDYDCILMMEHSPVYTLRRGADENYLTFLQQQLQEQGNGTTASLDFLTDLEAKRWRLSRKARGPGTARLTLDPHLQDAMERLRIDNCHTTVDHAIQMLQETVSTQVTPVHAPNGVPIYRVERGREVTFHGPQQLVVYPLLDLQNSACCYEQDLHWYLRQIETVIIQTLNDLGIANATRDEINTGVWVDEKKVAAVGISSSRWITTHGFALNVDPDLSYFDTSTILPCGVEGRGVTSIAEILREHQPGNAGTATSIQIPTMQQVADLVAKNMEDIFAMELRK